MTSLTVWCLSEKKQSLNPIKIRDIKSETVVSSVPIWNPARGHHYTNATSIIDLYNDSDPAIYTNAPVLPLISSAPPIKVNTWAEPEVGTVWMDTTNLDYKPYYDVNVFPNIEQRSTLWGELADWGEVVLYEWTKSDIPPSEWNTTAASEENDSSIPVEIRKSGTVKQDWFNNNSNQFIKNIFDEFVVELDYSTNPSPGTYTFSLTNINVGDDVNIYVNGTLTASNITVTSPFTLTGLSPTDSVRVVYPIDQQVLALNVTPGTATLETSYVEIKIDDIDNPTQTISTFYFWVRNKTTHLEKDLVSLKNAETQIAKIPSAYIFFQKVSGDEIVTIETEDQNKVNEKVVPNILDAAGQVVSLTLPVKDNDSANVSNVTVNGLAASYVYSPTTNSITILVDPTASLISEDKLIRVEYVAIFNKNVSLPPRYLQAVVRGLRGVVNEEGRYTLRFTRDFTLRDNSTHGETPLELKNLHSEWELFREKQLFHIRRSLWDRVTESIVGFKLSDSTIRVPSLDRELYDADFKSDTQYGLGSDQTLANGTTALETILFDLNNPDNDFSPIDIDAFFQNNKFDTSANIISSMDNIYNTFKFEDVNRMFFEVLGDSLSVKKNFSDLFKTSWLSLHGIRVLGTAEIFDD